jgi:hypothetical protein
MIPRTPRGHEFCPLKACFRPVAALQDRPYERAVRKRSLGEGGGCAKERSPHIDPGSFRASLC